MKLFSTETNSNSINKFNLLECVCAVTSPDAFKSRQHFKNQ